MLRSERAAWSLRAMLRVAVALPAAALFLQVSGSPVQAADIMFNFSTLAADGGANNTAAGDTYSSSYLSSQDADVQTYMDSQLTAHNSGWGVTVSGALPSGAAGGTVNDAGYTADGNVTCATGTSAANCVGGPTPEATLSTIDDMPMLLSNGEYPNSSCNNTPDDCNITMAFSSSNSTPVQTTSLSFDFEIFPNINCQSPSCGTSNLPDFTFELVNGNGTLEDEVKITATGVNTCSVSEVNTAFGTPTVTINSASSSTDNDSTTTDPQCTGSISYASFSGAVTNPTLEFVDWPATIGVTDINWGLPGSVPEPVSALIFGTGLVGLELFRRRRQRAA